MLLNNINTYFINALELSRVRFEIYAHYYRTGSLWKIGYCCVAIARNTLQMQLINIIIDALKLIEHTRIMALTEH